MKASNLHLALALTIAIGCGQSKDDATVSTPSDLAEGAAPKTLAFASPQMNGESMEEDHEVPPEKFSDGAAAFAHVRDQLKDEYYAEGISEDDLYRAATAGMLERMDPRMRKWNKLLSPHEMAEIKNDLKGEIIGVGMEIDFNKTTGYVAVNGTIPGSAAERAGIVAGDTIVRVNDKLYKGMSLRDVASDIRGKAGESVTLSVLRDGKIIPITVTREKISYDTPGQTVLPGNIGYVRIPSFTEKTKDAVKAALTDLAAKKVVGLVVDLRQNPGGLFEEAIHTAELFVPEGAPIVSTRKRKVAEEKIVSKAAPILGEVPLVVLVDAKTASGGELISEALREERHARLVGSRTMGKWSVQMIDDLPNNYAFKYTLSLLYAPNGQTYDGIGLEPDVEVAQEETQRARAQSLATAEARLAADVQLRTAVELLKR